MLTLKTAHGEIKLTPLTEPPLEPLTGAVIVLRFQDGTQIEAEIQDITGLVQN